MSGILPAQAPMGGGLLGSVMDQIDLRPAFTEPVAGRWRGQLILGEQDGDYLAGALRGVMGEQDDDIPLALRPYQAGLQPYIPPAGTEWTEEVVFNRIARDDRSIEAQMQSYFDEARNYDAALSTERMTANAYYAAKPFGDEEKGRSHLVLSTVRDTVRATLPSLLRIFTGVQNPCEFVPTVSDNEQLGLAHAELARQATAYAHWALFVANPGWMVLHDCILNSLTRKAGWVRWYWGRQREVRIEECNQLLEPQLRALLQESGITAERIVKRPMLPHELRAVMATPEGAMYLQGGGEPVFYGAQITRRAARGWPVVESVMPENVWIVADADQPGSARGLFHVRDVPLGSLLAAGLPEGPVRAAAQSGNTIRQRQEAVARDSASGNNLDRRSSSVNDPSMQLVRYVEGWCLMDTDGDGVAELIHTHGIGNNPKLVRWDRTDEVQLACFSTYREPGRVIGYSQADMVMDLQRTESRIMRAVLDSLGQSIYPRTVVQVGAANLEDARQTMIGSIIRVTTQGAVQELSKPFNGAAGLPVLERMEAIREARTGITRTSMGLTAESLQSTTPTAVNAQTSAAQDRLDMIARTLAETGLAPLYTGLLKMMAKQQDRPNVLSLRGKWIAIDPRALSIIWAVQVNVGGRGTPSERLQMLSAIAAKQEAILAPAAAQGMLDTPIVGLREYRNTLARMVESAGMSDVVSYFKELGPDWQPPPPPPPKPTPDELLAEVERLKTMLSAQDDVRTAQTAQQKLILEDNRSRLEAALSAWVTVYTAAAQHGTPVPSIDEFAKAVHSNAAIALTTEGGSIGAPSPNFPPSPAPSQVTPALGVPAGPRVGPVGVPPAAGQGVGIAPAPPAARSAPLALPPNALPAGANPALSPAAAIALRQRLTAPQGSGNIVAQMLAARSGLR